MVHWRITSHCWWRSASSMLSRKFTYSILKEDREITCPKDADQVTISQAVVISEWQHWQLQWNQHHTIQLKVSLLLIIFCRLSALCISYWWNGVSVQLQGRSHLHNSAKITGSAIYYCIIRCNSLTSQGRYRLQTSRFRANGKGHWNYWR